MSQLGASILAEFEILEYLGKSGRVIKARQRALDRMVVLKVFNPKFHTASEARSRFIEEGRLLARLRHPNVVQVYGVVEPPGEDPYLIMEAIEGRSLKETLKERPRLDPDVAIRYMDGICAALEGIHEHGVVHRNLKPENLLVDKSGQIRLLDFGLALAAERGGEADRDVVFGTPIYMSPEQVRGKALDARSDIYAAGVVFYELLVGKPPFTGPDPRAIMKAHVKQPLPDPAELGVALSRPFMHVLRRCLAKKPDERYPTATKLRERIKVLASGALDEDPEGVANSMVVALKRARRRKEGGPGLGKALGGVAVLGLAVAGIWFWSRAAASLDVAASLARPVRAEVREGVLELAWSTAAEVPSRIQYGYTEACEMLWQVPGARRDHAARLAELEPGRTVHYRVALSEAEFGPRQSIGLPTCWSLSEPAVRAGATWIRLEFTTAYPAAPRVSAERVGEAGGGRLAVALPKGTVHRAELTGLTAASAYRVRIRLAEDGRAPEWRELSPATEEIRAQRLFATGDGSPLVGSPLVLADRLVVGTAGGRIHAVARADGAALWTTELQGRLVAAPALAGGRVVAALAEGALVGLDPADGRKVWQTGFQGAPVGAPAVGGGAVAVATAGRVLAAAHPGSGALLWSQELPQVPSAGPAIDPRGDSFELVAGFEDGVVRGYGPGGRLLWEQPFGSRVESPPFFGGVGVAVVGEGNYLRMRESRKTPRAVARPGRKAFAGEVVEGKVLVLAARETGLIALDWEGGQELWVCPLPGGAAGPPRAAGGRIWVAAGDGAVACVSAERGDVLYRAVLGAAAPDGAVPAEDGAYAATVGGHVYRLED